MTSLFGSPRKPKTDSETLNMYCFYVFITCYCTVHNKYCKYTVHAFKSANKVISIDEKHLSHALKENRLSSLD